MAVDLQGALDAMRAFEDDPTADSLALLQDATGPVLEALVCHGDWPEWADRNKRAILKLKQDAREADAAEKVAAAEEFNRRAKEDEQQMLADRREAIRKEREEEAKQMREK